MSKIDLYNGDCLEVMKQIPNESIDLILCDLPYGTTNCKWDSIIPFDKLWEQYNRISKIKTPIILFGTEPFSSHLRMSNIKNFKYDWVWNKKSAANILVAKYQPLKVCEYISVFCKSTPNYYPIMTTSNRDLVKEKPCEKKTDMFSGIKSGKFVKTETNKKGTERYPKNLIEFSNANRKNHFHPTQKPVALMEYLIKTYTNEGDTVLDNCMGSGTTGVACKNTNRNFIGIELDEKYFNIAKERIENV
jgi:site-specific DNA-methyltransferase (adenine-specific)